MFWIFPTLTLVSNEWRNKQHSHFLKKEEKKKKEKQSMIASNWALDKILGSSRPWGHVARLEAEDPAKVKSASLGRRGGRRVVRKWLLQDPTNK